MRMKTAAVAAMCLGVMALAGGISHSATVRSLTLDTLVARSDRIVHGRVVGSHAAWDSETRTIWTHTEVLVIDSAKGSSGRTVTVSEPGGVVGDVGHLLPGVPRFRLNDEVVLFLHGATGNRLRVTGLRQGVYGVTRDGAGSPPMAHALDRQAEPVYESDSVRRPQVPEPLGERRLDEFMRDIRQRIR